MKKMFRKIINIISGIIMVLVGFIMVAETMKVNTTYAKFGLFVIILGILKMTILNEEEPIKNMEE